MVPVAQLMELGYRNVVCLICPSSQYSKRNQNKSNLINNTLKAETKIFMDKHRNKTLNIKSLPT